MRSPGTSSPIATPRTSGRSISRPERELVAASVAALVWIAALAGAPFVAAERDRAPHWQRTPAALVYLSASVICHQRPERSYHLSGAPLPVCARCLGLHVGAALGLLALAFAPDAFRAAVLRHARAALVIAALPIAASVLVEWAGGPSPMSARTWTALPAGAMAGALVGLALVNLSRGAAQAVRVEPSATLR